MTKNEEMSMYVLQHFWSCVLQVWTVIVWRCFGNIYYLSSHLPCFVCASDTAHLQLLPVLSSDPAESNCPHFHLTPPL